MPTLTFGSLFSGIGGMDLGLEQAGWRCLWQVEKDRQCNEVLAFHWPETERHGDVSTVETLPEVDLVCGGFPCQDLSVAGRRAGLNGDRSGLWWEFRRILAASRPRWVVIENVPGLFSSDERRDFGILLGSLAELGYLGAYRVLDAQYFGVAQRRRRVFIVGHLGDGRRAAEVLFDAASLQRHPPTRGEAGEGVAAGVEPFALQGSGGTSLGIQGRGWKRDGAHFTLNVVDRHSIAHALTAEGFDAGEDGTGRGTPLVAAPLTRGVDSQGKGGYAGRRREDDYNIALQCHGGNVGPMGTLKGEGVNTGVPVAFQVRGRGAEIEFGDGSLAGSLRAADGGSSRGRYVIYGFPRRLTPRECERLQGFPDDWTAVNLMKDSPRYRMLGNAVAVPVARWIGERLRDAIT